MATSKKARKPVESKPPAVVEPDEGGYVLEVVRGESDARAKARATVSPASNAALVIAAFNGNILGKDTSISGLVDELRVSMKGTRDGDLSRAEAMLIGQATALESIFTSLARRAHDQVTQRNFEAFLGLALKAQAQSRATLSALVDLKYPRQQVIFAKQVNNSNGGPQQVNNGAAPSTHTGAHAAAGADLQNKLLEESDGGTYLDIGATTAATRSDHRVEAVVEVNRAEERRG
ncbi:hypothetical protein [Variovorax sp. LG9.2]|uniref:hypothetical protein n=1 Tax=Variovorax sp. LG9.2 TaxID=3048626 RepID=UPI002B2248F1|nr:hypothetical protein [Variovorax sp. LG9.2]MEB0058803.1 hypothetical protein [Variovorax sp. LG9.2]